MLHTPIAKDFLVFGGQGGAPSAEILMGKGSYTIIQGGVRSLPDVLG